MDYRTDNLIEITWVIREYTSNGYIECIPFQELKEIIVEIADQFERLHKNSDWCELDYNEDIEKHTNKVLAKELWSRFGNVPMNPDTGEIESEWNGFPAGVYREEIWHWIEETFNVSVATDLMSL